MVASLVGNEAEACTLLVRGPPAVQSTIFHVRLLLLVASRGLGRLKRGCAGTWGGLIKDSPNVVPRGNYIILAQRQTPALAEVRGPGKVTIHAHDYPSLFVSVLDNCHLYILHCLPWGVYPCFCFFSMSARKAWKTAT